MAPNWFQRLRARVREDAAFTLVEVMVALGIATGVLTAFAYVSTGSLHALQIARLNQQGADLATARLEQLRNMPFGSLGHDPAGIVGDPHLAACGSAKCYDGEPLVSTVGGLKPQITAPPAVNEFQYTLYTYVTTPEDQIGEEAKRITVVAEWAAYGRTFSKTMSTIVSQTQRGLPLPEFKLAPVGPSTVTVNPGAKAAFGFQLNNQGAPDQWNITSDASQYRVLLDNGDDVFNEAEDTVAMSDHNGDGIPDTGRLEPKQSIVFWVVRDVPDTATNSTSRFDVTAEAAAHEGMAGASKSLTSTLVVTTAVVTPTPTASASTTPSASPSATCEAATPAPTPSAQTGYTVKSYVLHNSGAVSWPTFPLPPTGTIPGSKAMSPMYMDMNPVSIPADRDLPFYSTDLTPFNTPGRLVYSGGSFSSTSASSVLDFRTQNPNRGYAGTMVLRMWVKPVAGESVHLVAKPYTMKTNGNTAVTQLGAQSDLTMGSFTCSGFQEVWFSFNPGTVSASQNTVLGVRVWNAGTSSVQAAYDHGAYPATFTVAER